ncbi:MAG: hypothetical protein Ct9H300mP1_28990 [Planctomycetaceae bacterium]|nr:MAG: hypothetical protein Ct9H300mP1_28990 [Planctomycetaceae bacterium]
MTARSTLLATTFGSEKPGYGGGEEPRVAGRLVREPRQNAIGTREKKHVIDNISRGPCHGHPVDLDDDGDLDVVRARTGCARRSIPRWNGTKWSGTKTCVTPRLAGHGNGT